MCYKYAAMHFYLCVHMYACKCVLVVDWMLETFVAADASVMSLDSRQRSLANGL